MSIFLVPWDSSQSGHEQHVFHRRQFVEQGVELRTIADGLEHFSSLFETVESVDERRARRRSEIAGEHSKGRRLPGAIHAAQSKTFSRANSQTQIVHGDEFLSFLRSIAFGEIRQSQDVIVDRLVDNLPANLSDVLVFGQVGEGQSVGNARRVEESVFQEQRQDPKDQPADGHGDQVRDGDVPDERRADAIVQACFLVERIVIILEGEFIRHEHREGSFLRCRRCRSILVRDNSWERS